MTRSKVCFQLRSLNEKGSAFHVPLAYKAYADQKKEAELPEVDLLELRKQYGEAVAITDKQAKAAEAERSSEF